MTNRAVLAVVITITLSVGAFAQTNSSKSKGTDVSGVFSPLFNMYCTACHNQTRKTAGLALDSLDTRDVGENSAIWGKVLRRLGARRDPSTGAPHPEEALYQSAISTLEFALDRAYPMNPSLNSANGVS